MHPAPIALFVYNRPQHTARTLEALRRNDLAAESDLTVYSDGPKTEGDRALVAEVRELARGIEGFRSVTLVARERNAGLAASIIAGVDEQVQSRGRIIVLEDDMVTSRYFLRYLNEALELYACDEEVISIHGYVYPVGGALPVTFFLRGADCWGWGTWKRGWDLFEPDGGKLLAKLERRGLEEAFDLDGAYPYTQMLRDQISGANDSWAIRWHASAFLNGRLTLYPGRTLVRNIGNDASGTHCDATDAYDAEVAVDPVELRRIPLQVDDRARAEIVGYFRGMRQEGRGRVGSALRRIGRRLALWPSEKGTAR